MNSNWPTSDVDLWADDEALLNPYPLYRELRDRGPAVWLPKYEMFALARYQAVRDALRNWQTFSSAHGVFMNERMNTTATGTTLCSDSPVHERLRRVIIKPLTPVALKELKDRVTAEAEALVERLVARKTFDAATDLAQYLPVSIVSYLVGLPEEGRERMLQWAAAGFNSMAPLNERTVASFPLLEEMREYRAKNCVRGKLVPGSWADRIYDAADRGEIRHDECLAMISDYVGPSLDTTINATSSAIWLFAQHADQWDILRKEPALIPNAVNEVVRLESPIQAFSRYVTENHDFEGVALPKGSRVIILYGSANRDERRWEEPERFDVRRKVGDHVGFSHGVHTCAGMHLARLEITALLTALARRVERFELREMRREVHNILRGLRKLDVTVH